MKKLCLLLLLGAPARAERYAHLGADGVVDNVSVGDATWYAAAGAAGWKPVDEHVGIGFKAWIGGYVAPLPATMTRAAGEALSLDSTVYGKDGVAYQWQKDGVDIKGATGPFLKIKAAAPGDAGEYSCSLAGGNKKMKNGTASVKIAPPAGGTAARPTPSSGPNPIFAASGSFPDVAFANTARGGCLPGSSVNADCNNAKCRFIAEYYGSLGNSGNNATTCAVVIDGTEMGGPDGGAWRFNGDRSAGGAWTVNSAIKAYSGADSTAAGNPHAICLSCSVGGGTGGLKNNHWFIQEVPR